MTSILCGMNGILQNLLKLQRLDFGEQPKNASQAAALRAAIPSTMLQQYERLRARGKKGIALVHNRVCTNCRMQVPIAVAWNRHSGLRQLWPLSLPAGPC